MRVAVLSVAGEVARLSAEPSWGLSEVLTAIQEQHALPSGARVQIFHGRSRLLDTDSLPNIEVAEDSQLTLVLLPPLRFLTAYGDKTAKLWDAASGECLHTFEGHGYCVCSAAFSPDGQQVVTASSDRTAKLWAAASGECLHAFEGHRGLGGPP